MIESLLGKLNRLRLNTGKTELMSWKTSTAKLHDAIAKLEAEGAVDVLPGAKLDVQPITDDPDIAKLRPPEDEAPAPEEEDKVTKVPTGLARGIDVQDTWTRHSREKMKDSKAADKAALKLSDADKKQIKDEAEARGKVDAKKDPEKAARQQKHIADKKAAREAKGEKPKIDKASTDVGKDQITIADLAREIGREPKIVRSKLRRPKYSDAVAKLRVKGRDDWVFPKSARDELLKLLR